MRLHGALRTASRTSALAPWVGRRRGCARGRFGDCPCRPRCGYGGSGNDGASRRNWVCRAVYVSVENAPPVRPNINSIGGQSFDTLSRVEA